MRDSQGSHGGCLSLMKLHKTSYDYKEVRLSSYSRFTFRIYNEDGSINVTDPRSGKSMHQTYSWRGNQMKKSCTILEAIAPGVKSHLQITPGDWPNGKTNSHNDSVFDLQQSSRMNSTTIDFSSNGSMIRTPMKRLGRDITLPTLHLIYHHQIQIRTQIKS